MLSSLLYLHVTLLGHPHNRWINPSACVCVCEIRRAGCSGAFPFKAMKQNAWKHAHKLDENTQNPAGNNRVKMRATGLEEKKAVVFFFYYVSGWSTQPEGWQHTHTEMEGTLIKSNEKGICVGAAQCFKHPTHTLTHIRILLTHLIEDASSRYVPIYPSCYGKHKHSH